MPLEPALSLPSLAERTVSAFARRYGRSGSAALEVGLAMAIESLGGYQVDPKRRALLCQLADHYLKATGIQSTQFVTGPMQGAHLIAY